MARPNCSRNDPKSRRSRVEMRRVGSITTRVVPLSAPSAKAARPRQKPAPTASPVIPVCFRNRLLGIFTTGIPPFAVSRAESTRQNDCPHGAFSYHPFGTPSQPILRWRHALNLSRPPPQWRLPTQLDEGHGLGGKFELRVPGVARGA